jgi:hypothetical protein
METLECSISSLTSGSEGTESGAGLGSIPDDSIPLLPCLPGCLPAKGRGTRAPGSDSASTRMRGPILMESSIGLCRPPVMCEQLPHKKKRRLCNLSGGSRFLHPTPFPKRRHRASASLDLGPRQIRVWAAEHERRDPNSRANAQGWFASPQDPTAAPAWLCSDLPSPDRPHGVCLMI